MDMSYFHYNPKYLAGMLFSSLLLTACGGGGGGSSSSPAPDTGSSKQISITANDILDNQILNQQLTIDLSDSVNTSDGSAFELQSIKPLSSSSPACQLLSQNKTQIRLSSSSPATCDYEYQVKAQQGTQTATSVIRASFNSTYAQKTFSTLYESATKGEELAIDLSSLIPEGAYLNYEVTILGSGAADVDTNAQTITYIASDTDQNLGSHRILYSVTLENGDVQSGVIVVTVSGGEGNTPPSAQDIIFERLVGSGEVLTIDVTDYVSDPDQVLGDNGDYVSGDKLQLTAVEDFNASVAPVDSESFENMSFTFESDIPGEHLVSYTVSDHQGGYATGLAKFQVTSDFSLLQDWQDIVTTDVIQGLDIRFLAPMSQEFADYYNIDYTQVAHEDGMQGPSGATIVTQTFLQAEKYCRLRDARLPTVRELGLLADIDGGVYEQENWPASVSFWSAEHASVTSAYALHLLTSNQEEVDASEDAGEADARYTTCVALEDGVSDFTFNIDDALLEVAPMSITPYQFNIKTRVYNPDGELAPYETVRFSGVLGAGFNNDTQFNFSASAVADNLDENAEITKEFRLVKDTHDAVNLELPHKNIFETKIIQVQDFDSTDISNQELWQQSLLKGSDGILQISDLGTLLDGNGPYITAPAGVEVNAGTEDDPIKDLSAVRKFTEAQNNQVYYFDIDGEAFSTLVIDNALVISVGEGSRPTGYATERRHLTGAEEGILPASVVAKFTGADLLHLEHRNLLDGSSMVDVNSTNENLLTRAINYQSLHRGKGNNNIYNDSWTGTGSERLTVDAICSSGVDDNLAANVIHVCGATESFNWTPNINANDNPGYGYARYKFDEGEIGENEVLRLALRPSEDTQTMASGNINVLSTLYQPALIGHQEVVFTINRSDTLNGIVNIVLQQKTPVLPSIENGTLDDCDPTYYGGTCQWFTDNTELTHQGAETAGLPDGEGLYIQVNSLDQTLTLHSSTDELVET